MSDFEVSDVSEFEADSGSDFEMEPVPKKAKKSATTSPPANKVSPKAKKAKTNSASVSKSTTPAGNASDQYQKLSQLEHILKRPDTYVGSVEATLMEMWIYDEETESMVEKTVTIVPGLYKIFDEILVNAADNKIRDPSMKSISVTIDPESNTIEVKNDGRGIPVQIHDKEHVYIPELIFGTLLTSSNYDDDQKKVTGGRNGYGAKLCNIFSTDFTVETNDLASGLLYTQTWRNNMSDVGKPKIRAMKKGPEYTKITFRPDLAKFGMEKLDNDILGVMRRRVYDLCGSVRDISVNLNGKRLKIRNFKQYVEMYVRALEEKKPKAEDSEDVSVPPPIKPTIVHEVFNERWEVAFALSSSSFNQVSFVNSIATTSGGTHVNYISDQIINKLIAHVKAKKKKAIIKPFQVKNNIFLFVNCLVENPSFTSQTKEQLTTRPAQYGGKIEITDDFIKKILRTGILDAILETVNANEDKALNKTDGSKKRRITSHVMLEDANKAGTKEGYKCTLILTEGNSALSLAVAGLAVVGRDYYGCFPLRGKLLNVREASADQIMKNAEIEAIKKIMGLQHRKRYDASTVKDLRYGHIMIMTDQDHDGSHIKGLIINFLETSFPGLLEVPGFLVEFITPIIKVTVSRGNTKEIIPFYTMPEYETWRDTHGTSCTWKQKYYKGLGTSKPTEGREYFKDLDRHLKTFHALQMGDSDLIDLAFSKKKADDRKEWLRGFQPGTFLDNDIKEIPISDFINKELILFSMADNVRSIPSVLDGFKPGQRKILYGCFKRKLKLEIKVSQLVGYISEHTGYHHGEASLFLTIVGLAQDFVGSNNLFLLKPNGCFGTRNMGGKDASAARYIFTELSKITRKVFNPLDEALYNYVQDDEQTVEPEWYLPVVPMLLVNGAEGIGTGWSTNIPPFNPVDIIKNIRNLMVGKEMEEMVPWFRGWNGGIQKIALDKYRVTGRVEKVDDNTVEITELPAKMWTVTMKEFLLKGLGGDDKAKPWIKDMTEQHGVGIKFVVTLTDEEMRKAEAVGLYERFKLVGSVSLSNMVAFDPSGRIKKYDSVLDMVSDFYFVRLEFYHKRKEYLTDQLRNQLIKLSSQARFVKMIIDREFTVANRKRADLVAELQEKSFPRFGKDGVPITAKIEVVEITRAETREEDASPEGEGAENATGDAVHSPTSIYQQYDYLLSMAIWSLTRERYEKLLEQVDAKQTELTELLKLSPKDLWNRDLDDFSAAWDEFLSMDLINRTNIVPDADGKKKTSKRPKAKKENGVKEEPAAKKKKTGSPPAKKGAVGKQQTLPIKAKTPEPEFQSVFGGKNGLFKKEGSDSFADLTVDDIFDSIPSSSSKKMESFYDDFVETSAKTSAVKPRPKAAALDSDDGIEVVKPKAAPKKTAPKKAVKPKSRSETPSALDELELSDISAPSSPQPARQRTSRRPATAVKKSYVLSDLSDNSDSYDEEDDDEEFGSE
ncbi:hypothetical protein BABINDRAFT_162139 [Babjeviella inositovora NRRL Y-12698]|uniref:DNA topoisomerase 2 n=1 Tax=Babjeviella inositovora NRRL Y-12698 TaxID=984486 RepID=A0A1E3QMZ4_9ASCO|nr:uncharacterized protein BABINDRAFT_162139 [Babjeviella inositovora NRRL Y-12698]ODQ79069.1 hypothetical protein BABINDRAFT_162139 [Babjeviella inositovora NRRL Y-12698]